MFDPEAKYIWALLGDGDGGLLVGTGPEGKLHRVDLGSGESTLLYDSTDLHIRSLARRADGTLFAGTAGEGLLLEIDAAGSARTLYDAAGPEVLAIVQGDEGAFYATALGLRGELRRPEQLAQVHFQQLVEQRERRLRRHRWQCNGVEQPDHPGHVPGGRDLGR